jgi:uncharacterized protein (TIGR00730 family)
MSNALDATLDFGKKSPKRVCVFCGSSIGVSHVFADDARLLAGAVVDSGMQLVFGGGGTGLMRTLAEAVQSRGGQVIGIIPEVLLNTENVFEALDQRYIVRSYHERKMLMYQLSDAFIALPGGPGTLEELLEHLTWMHRGNVQKPVYLINVSGYWQSFLQMFDEMRASGFISDSLTDRCIVFDSSALAIRDLISRVRNG